jgi:hypothetical protein
MMFRTTRISIALVCAAASGCSSLAGVSSALNPFGTKTTIADAKNPAVEVACIWQPGEGRGEKGVPARGFSGQIYFFTNNGSEPVLVNGSMRIYLFADVGTPEERTRPLKQFDYEPAAWSAHAAMGSLGPSYSVFVPYPRVEAYQVRCQLRARFTPADGGPPIWSEAVNMVLDGPPEPGAEPAWWTNVDRKSTPSAPRLDITHERGTLEQLRQKDEAATPERTLRTDTFSLDAIRPVSYEFPAFPNRTRRESRPVAKAISASNTARNVGRHEQVPSDDLKRSTSIGRQSENGDDADHPLAAFGAGEYGGSQHPFAGTANPLLTESPPGDDATMEREVPPSAVSETVNLPDNPFDSMSEMETSDGNTTSSNPGVHPLAL